MAVKIPVREADYVFWLQSLKETATNNQAALMLTPGQLADIQSVADDLAAAHQEVEAAKAALRGAIEAKDGLMEDADHIMRTYLQMIASNPAVTPELKARMSIDVVRASAAPVVSPRDLTVDPVATGETHLKWHRNGNARSVQFIVEQRVGDSAKWHLAGVTSKTRISLRGNRVGEQVFYRVRATRGDKTSGSSNIATAYPDPSGLPRHRARAA